MCTDQNVYEPIISSGRIQVAQVIRFHNKNAMEGYQDLSSTRITSGIVDR